MRRILSLFTALCLSVIWGSVAWAQGFSGGTGGAAVSINSHVVTDDDETGNYPNSRQLVDGTNTTVDVTTPGQIKVNASASGGSSPFAPAGFANVSTFQGWYDLAIAPAGDYVYVAGRITSNNHGGIAKVKIADGSVTATCDLGATDTNPYSLAVSPDGAALFCGESSGSAGVDWFKITTATMVIAHTSTLAVPMVTTSKQAFDLSPDGAIYAYVSGVDDKVYKINTSTYAVTSVTVGHSDGGSAGTSSVCWYNGSSANFYVAYIGLAAVDLYSAGVYTSTVSTGAGGTPAFNAMRSGINSSLFIADSGDNKELITVNSGTPTLTPLSSVTAIAVSTGGQVSTGGTADVCFIQSSGSATNIFRYDKWDGLCSVFMPQSIDLVGTSGIAVAHSSAETVYTLSGSATPEVWSLSPIGNFAPGTAGYMSTSNGKGESLNIAPFSTSGWTGNDTISGGGTVTVTCAPCTTGSIIDVSPTGTNNVLPPAVTTKSAGSFVVTGSATGTFDWCLLSP